MDVVATSSVGSAMRAPFKKKSKKQIFRRPKIYCKSMYNNEKRTLVMHWDLGFRCIFVICRLQFGCKHIVENFGASIIPAFRTFFLGGGWRGRYLPSAVFFGRLWMLSNLYLSWHLGEYSGLVAHWTNHRPQNSLQTVCDKERSFFSSFCLHL